MDANNVDPTVAPPPTASYSTQATPTNIPEGEQASHVIKCSQCGKVFDRRQTLNRHLKSHSDERPYLCPVAGCNRSTNGFKRTDTLKYHMDTVHSKNRGASGDAKGMDGTGIAATSAAAISTVGGLLGTKQAAPETPSAKSLGKRKLDETEDNLVTEVKRRATYAPGSEIVWEQTPEDKIATLESKLEEEYQKRQELGRWYENVLAQLNEAKDYHAKEMVKQREKCENIREKYEREMKEQQSKHEEREGRLWEVIRKR